ncbi:MAG: HAMP domain-containing sensor histidine kinase, partial [Angelakisella sp.]
MPKTASALPENIAHQFENACFPFWVVDDKLDIIYFNKRAKLLHPSSCLPDGLRLLLSPADCEEIIRLIALGESVSSASSVLSATPATALAFSPFLEEGEYRGAYVMLTPITDLPDDDMDLRQSMLGASSLVITREFKKCVSEIFYALSTCSGKLKAAGVDIADAPLRSINESCYRIMRNTDSISERIKYASNLPTANHCVDFWDNCAELFEACSTVLRAQHIFFSYDLPDTVVYVNCDFEKITTALLHLISNCYLHCQSDVQVTVTGRDTAEGILLTVSDNGQGIPAEVQEHIFQPFAWGILDRDEAGMGLGLNIVRNIVTQAEGKLAMNSGEDGTTVAISLPRAE